MSTKTLYTGDATITDEGIAELRGRMGKVYPARPWITIATLDAIVHFADGVGDDNPLFHDPAYARLTRYKKVIAPPTFVYVFCSAGFGPAYGGLPGVYSLYSEDTFEFHKPVSEGGRYTADEELVGVEVKPSQWSGRAVHQLIESRFYDQRGNVIAKRRSRRVRGERGAAREHKKYAPWAPYRYSKKEIERISTDYLNEFRRGAEVLYWEDVPPKGTQIPSIVKGPLTVTDMVTWMMGWGSPLCKTNKIAWQYYRKHPGAAIYDPDTNIPDLAEAAHWDVKRAQMGGVPGPYDIGPQRVSWYAQMLTNWIGDSGWLSRLSVQIRRPNLVGDTTRLQGKVSRKYVEGGQALVDVEVWGTNQRGEVNSSGTATVMLPSKLRSRQPRRAEVVKPPPAGTGKSTGHVG